MNGICFITPVIRNSSCGRRPHGRNNFRRSEVRKMDRNGKKIKSETAVSDKTLREMLKNQRIASAAVHRAQEESRKLGVPNWYSINGKIVSDQEISEKDKKSE